MGTRLNEMQVRGQTMAADRLARLLARVRSERGQTTVEWIALMVGFTALVTILAGADVWQKFGHEIVNTVNLIFGSGDDRV